LPPPDTPVEPEDHPGNEYGNADYETREVQNPFAKLDLLIVLVIATIATSGLALIAALLGVSLPKRSLVRDNSRPVVGGVFVPEPELSWFAESIEQDPSDPYHYRAIFKWTRRRGVPGPTSEYPAEYVAANP